MMKYDENFEPPAPIAQAQLRNTETGNRVKNVPMLLDTGADISFLPIHFVKNLSARDKTR